MTTVPPSSTEWNAKYLRLAVTAAGVALWSWNVDTDRFTMDEHGYKLWDLPFRPFVIFERSLRENSPCRSRPCARCVRRHARHRGAV